MISRMPNCEEFHLQCSLKSKIISNVFLSIQVSLERSYSIGYQWTSIKHRFGTLDYFTYLYVLATELWCKHIRHDVLVQFLFVPRVHSLLFFFSFCPVHGLHDLFFLPLWLLVGSVNQRHWRKTGQWEARLGCLPVGNRASVQLWLLHRVWFLGLELGAPLDVASYFSSGTNCVKASHRYSSPLWLP